jgi:DNA-binding protein H-NS
VSKVKPLGEEMALRKKASSVIADIRELMAEHGLTTADIEAHTGKAKAGAKRGPKPGFKRAGMSAAAAPAKKAVSPAKGKLPPKYRDPRTGATWSGHARPPAWIKDVKDRSKFLIGGAGAAADAGVSTKTKLAAKKAVAKKAVVKKVAATKAVPTKKAAVKKTAAKKAASAKAPAKKAPAKKAAPAVVKKAPAKKAPRKSVA